ncbi:hypothetical protein IAU59_003950 [Kwoniella sp. CBS 9459]
MVDSSETTYVWMIISYTTFARPTFQSKTGKRISQRTIEHSSQQRAGLPAPVPVDHGDQHQVVASVARLREWFVSPLLPFPLAKFVDGRRKSGLSPRSTSSSPPPGFEGRHYSEFALEVGESRSHLERTDQWSSYPR